MQVRLLGTISGTRDGMEWPPRGSVVELPDDEARALIKGEMAVEVAEPTTVQMAVARTAAVETPEAPPPDVKAQAGVAEAKAVDVDVTPGTGLTKKSTGLRASKQ